MDSSSYINPHGIPLALAPHDPWSMLGFCRSWGSQGRARRVPRPGWCHQRSAGLLCFGEALAQRCGCAKSSRLGKFHHDLTVRANPGNHGFILGKSSQNGRTIQVSEL